MNSIHRPDVDSVLAQMRALQQAAQGRDLQQAMEIDAPARDDHSSFGELLNSAVDNVNSAQKQAGDLSNAFLRGETQDLVRVMVSMQKANVSFQALLQARNRMVSAYKDIMNMPI